MILTDTKYIPEHLPPEGLEKAWALAFLGKKLLMKKAGTGFRIPTLEELQRLKDEFGESIYIGRYGEAGCYCMQANVFSMLPAELEPVELRSITGLTGDPGLFLLAGTANHILHWNRMNQYCGRCGYKTTDKADERAKVCPSCGNVVYPRISPATITAVLRGDEILLARNRNFQGNLHSLIAGFTEPGETLEQCAAREIGEEVGIKVKNIRYFGSQPWPFPDSLMVAFTAEYESGDITVDNNEIMEADWYSAGALPEIPSSDSIAGKIIRWYRGEHAKTDSDV